MFWGHGCLLSGRRSLGEQPEGAGLIKTDDEAG